MRLVNLSGGRTCQGDKCGYNGGCAGVGEPVRVRSRGIFIARREMVTIRNCLPTHAGYVTNVMFL